MAKSPTTLDKNPEETKQGGKPSLKMNTNADDFEPDQINASSLAQDLATEIDSLLVDSNSSLLSSIVLDEKAKDP